MVAQNYKGCQGPSVGVVVCDLNSGSLFHTSHNTNYAAGFEAFPLSSGLCPPVIIMLLWYQSARRASMTLSSKGTAVVCNSIISSKSRLEMNSKAGAQ
jgi:hypothetical protein